MNLAVIVQCTSGLFSSFFQIGVWEAFQISARGIDTLLIDGYDRNSDVV